MISHKITVTEGTTGHDGMTANENDRQQAFFWQTLELYKFIKKTF
jgi:hypothetical protein